MEGLRLDKQRVLLQGSRVFPGQEAPAGMKLQGCVIAGPFEKERVKSMEEMLYKGCIIRSACKEVVGQSGRWLVGLDIITTDSGFKEIQPCHVMVNGAPVFCDTKQDAIKKSFQLGCQIIDQK